MNTLIVLGIVLIVAILFDTCLNIYCRFLDKNANKQFATTISMMESAMERYNINEARLNEAIANRDTTIRDWQKSYNEVAKIQNYTVKYLPNVIQKEAMRKVVEGISDEHDIEVIKDYLTWLKTIKYDDTEEHNK